MRLWVDDERPAPDDGDDWIVAVSSEDAIFKLGRVGRVSWIWREVSLDHDLGGEDTGMRVIDYFIQANFWPQEITVHTANPPARARMLATLNAEAPDHVKISVIYR